MPFPEVAYDPNDPYAYLGATAGSYEQPQAPGTSVAEGGWLPWAQDSYASQAGYAVESPEWNRVWALEQQYRNSPELYAGQSFFDWLASRDPELAQTIRNPATEAYDQRMRLLASQGQERYGNIESDIRDLQNGGPVAQAALLLGTIGGTAGLLAGGAGAAAGGAGGAGAATTYPVTTGPLATGGAITATPIAADAAGLGGAAASGAGAAAAPVGNALNTAGTVANAVPDWVGNYLLPGLNTLIGANAANNATDAQTQANQAAIDESRRQFDTTRTDLMPWLDAGKGALTKLNDPTNYFTNSPGYQSALKTGLQAATNSASAKGTLKSGNALKALEEYGIGIANQDFGNWWNQQAGLAGVGQTAATNLGDFGANNSGRVGNYLMNQGDARASGVLGRNAAIINGINQSYRNRLYTRP